MATFTAAEKAACQILIDLAVREDLGVSGDRTTTALVPSETNGAAVIVARAAGVIAGLPAAMLVAEVFDPRMKFRALRSDGDIVQCGERIAVVRGRMRSILMAERTMLNFVQRLSGIATLTRRYMDAVAGLHVQVLDTRKTIPGWRLLEKYAVRMGGGHNHRIGLYDGILVKDNHLAVLADYSDPIGTAMRRVRTAAPDLPVEIEVDSFDQFVRALACSPDVIMLDNMTLDEIRSCIDQRRAAAVPVQLEVSGGVQLANIRSIAETGVDRISVGALTYSAVALDLALDFEDEDLQ
jgi:nicotinate-nucleotide pyrophosphorylase (carboxylating)